MFLDSSRVVATRLASGLMLAAVLSACGTSGRQPSTAAAPAATPAVATKPVKIGLALGGGAARGFAHVGVIKALEAQGIHPDIVVGTSAGSVVGALYAAGNNGFALHKLALEMDEAAMSDWAIPVFSRNPGVIKGEAIQQYVNRAVGNQPLEKLKMRFAAVATDLHTGAPILFERGNTGAAVRASSAVPGVFQPVRIGDRTFVDGGLTSPVPARFAREMGADFVIAVNISSPPDEKLAATSVDMLLQTFSIMGQTISRYELKDADVVIRPDLGAMRSHDFTGRNLAILAGEKAAMAQMGEIKTRLRQKQGL